MTYAVSLKCIGLRAQHDILLYDNGEQAGRWWGQVNDRTAPVKVYRSKSCQVGQQGRWGKD